MTTTQQSQCQNRIYTTAALAATGNTFPVPGVGVAVNLAAMIVMATQLAAVFGGNLTNEEAKAMAIASITHTVIKQPIHVLSQELVKLIPFVGQVVAPAISFALVKSAGWAMANELDIKFPPQPFPSGA